MRIEAKKAFMQCNQSLQALVCPVFTVCVKYIREETTQPMINSKHEMPKSQGRNITGSNKAHFEKF